MPRQAVTWRKAYLQPQMDVLKSVKYKTCTNSDFCNLASIALHTN
uniref:Uncharacterized protein n=1 Tax=Anguilla anguilla TaxID=7936 RepID=A0A0E9RV44_ANGAN